MGQQANQFAGPAPVWLAALVATGCHAVSSRECHPIGWNLYDGRALYTNVGALPELIEPLAVTLAAGDTLSVTWMPGETGYTVHVSGAEARCA